jgi:hypothetical protein
MSSWSWRSINTVICCIWLVLILLHCLSDVVTATEYDSQMAVVRSTRTTVLTFICICCWPLTLCRHGLFFFKWSCSWTSRCNIKSHFFSFFLCDLHTSNAVNQMRVYNLVYRILWPVLGVACSRRLYAKKQNKGSWFLYCSNPFSYLKWCQRNVDICECCRVLTAAFLKSSSTMWRFVAEYAIADISETRNAFTCRANCTTTITTTTNNNRPWNSPPTLSFGYPHHPHLYNHHF